MFRAHLRIQTAIQRIAWLGAALLASGSGPSFASAETARPTAILLEVKGAISPASADYVLRGLAAAEERGAALVVLRLDTPGGLDSSMRDIIQAILAADIPVVTYVTPRGARAASAGTYILYASHIAAMAPATTLGAATPIQIGGPPNPFSPPEQPTEKPPDQAADKAARLNPRQGTRRRPTRRGQRDTRPDRRCNVGKGDQ
jgi:membrane-bound serine protease (ClpP class)